MIAPVLVCLFALSAGDSIAQTIYKWVDEKGITHYTEHPPQDRKPKRLDLPTQAPSLPAASEAPAVGREKWREDSAAFSRRWEDKKKADEEQELKSARELADRQAKCAAARAELAQLTATQPAIRFRPANSDRTSARVTTEPAPTPPPGSRPASVHTRVLPREPFYAASPTIGWDDQVMNNAQRTEGINRAEEAIRRWCK